MGRISHITRSLVDRINKLVGYGLTEGVGERGRGTMCVQACVQAALEEEHNDRPVCVPSNRRDFGILMNDHEEWDSDIARGKGLKRFAIAQLGDSTRPENVFYPLIIDQCYEKRFWKALQGLGAEDDDVQAAKRVRDKAGALRLREHMRTAAKKLDEKLSFEMSEFFARLPDREASSHYASAILDAFYPESIDNEDLCEFAEFGVQACIKMRTEGSEWLEKYEKKKGAERDKFIKQETKKGEIQEAAARRFSAQNGAAMRTFLGKAVDNNPEGLSLDEVLEQLSNR